MLAVFVAWGIVGSTEATGQDRRLLDVTVRSSIGQQLSYSTIEVASGLSRFTDESGHALLAVPAGDRVRVRIRHLGYAPVDTTMVLKPDQARHRLVVTLDPVVFRIATISVKARSSCKVLTDSASQIGRLVGELRKNAERELLLRNHYPFSYRLARKFEIGEAFSTGFRYDTVEFQSAATLSYQPGRMVRSSPLSRGSSTRALHIPTLIDLSQETFLRAHCFSYAGTTTMGGRKVHRIDFRPVPEIGTPDVAGSAYLDADTFVVREAVFRLTNPMLVSPPVGGMEVTTTYREILPGLPLIDMITAHQQVAGSRYPRLEEQRLVDVRFLGDRPGDSLPPESAGNE